VFFHFNVVFLIFLKVGTTNKSTGATHKVSARKGLLTRSRARSLGVAVAVASVVKEERKRRKRTRRRMKMAIAAAVTATKNLAVLPCIRYIHIFVPY
jgi:hypothetical protein